MPDESSCIVTQGPTTFGPLHKIFGRRLLTGEILNLKKKPLCVSVSVVKEAVRSHQNPARVFYRIDIWYVRKSRSHPSVTERSAHLETKIVMKAVEVSAITCIISPPAYFGRRTFYEICAYIVIRTQVQFLPVIYHDGRIPKNCDGSNSRTIDHKGERQR